MERFPVRYKYAGEPITDEKAIECLRNFMNKPLVTKQDIRLGNIFEQGIVCKINGRTGAKVHVYGKLKWKKGLKVIESVAVEDLKPIALSPQVLVDWCGFKNLGVINPDIVGHQYSLDCIAIQHYKEFGYFKAFCTEINYLHELQNLYYAINKKELEIKE